MTTDTDVSALDGAIDPQIDYGDAERTRRKAQLQQYDAPMSALAAHGIDVPREFHPERARHFQHTIHVDGTPVALHQRIVERQDSNNPFADEQETTDWVVVSLDDGTIVLKNPGAWDRKREVTPEEFADSDLEPVTVLPGVPEWAY